MSEETSIGTICNHYGGLVVKTEGDKYYWGIENYDGTDWEELPKSLYDELTGFELERDFQEKYGQGMTRRDAEGILRLLFEKTGVGSTAYALLTPHEVCAVRVWEERPLEIDGVVFFPIIRLPWFYWVM